jgi:sulfite reductase alpha subunit-like flavoprotein
MNDELLILFATTTGNAEDCAKSTATKAKEAGFKVRTVNMYDLKPAKLKDEKLFLAVVSTWGDGEPPDDAVPFWDDLQELEEGSLSGAAFAVFGLGDHDYDDFCGFAKKLDAEFERLGATRVLDRVDADTSFEEPLETWAAEVVEALQARA